MIRFPISYDRKEGPKTPNFRKLSKMLRSDISLKVNNIDRDKIVDQHNGVGIKMITGYRILGALQQIRDHVKAWRDGKVVYITKQEFLDLLVNLQIFVFELYSILDYVAAEMALILELKKRKRRKTVLIDPEWTSFTEVKKAVNLKKEMKWKIKGLTKKPWFDYFHAMRNRVTHRLPISLGALLVLDEKIIQFPFLPDKPLESKPTFYLQLNPLIECEKWLEGVFAFVDDVSCDLGKELFDTF